MVKLNRLDTGNCLYPAYPLNLLCFRYLGEAKVKVLLEVNHFFDQIPALLSTVNMWESAIVSDG
jgi:hypothetical protein